jgi:hypothetical protein
MAGRYGLVYDDDPYIMARKLLTYRSRNGFPCIEGPVTMESFKNEEIKKAVFAFFVSVMSRVILNEPVHFGLIGSPQYNLFAAICTQNSKYCFTEKCKYEWREDPRTGRGEMFVGGQEFWKVEETVQKLEIIVPVMAGDSVDRIVDIDCLAPLSEAPTICPLPEIRVDPVGFDVVDYEIESDESEDEEVVSYVSGTATVGDTMNVVVPRMIVVMNTTGKRNWLMTYSTKVMEIDVTGMRIDDRRHIVLQDSECDLDYCYYAYITGPAFSIRITYKWRGRYTFYSEVQEELSKLARAFEKRAHEFIGNIVKELQQKRISPLRNYNLKILSSYIPGRKMPSAHLLNQCLLMIGKSWLCSASYCYLRERWPPYEGYESWVDIWQSYVADNRVFRNVMSLFDERKFMYEGHLFYQRWGSLYRDPQILWCRVNCYMPYDIYEAYRREGKDRGMTGSQYLEWLGITPYDVKVVRDKVVVTDRSIRGGPNSEVIVPSVLYGDPRSEGELESEDNEYFWEDAETVQ